MTIAPGYMSGFGNGFETEALPGALPIGRNSPQKCAYGLYAEQLSRLALHRAAHHQRALLALPHPPDRGALGPVREGRHRPVAHRARAARWTCRSRRCAGIRSRSRTSRSSFVEGVRTITTAGDAGAQAGMGAHVYLVTRSMEDEYFYNADGEMLFVPQEGELRLWTEFGIIDIEPGEIAVIPRGVKIRVELTDGPARGYLCENYGGAFTLPERGPIGANCLANPRDFLTPVAAYEDKDAPSRHVREVGRRAVGDASSITRRSTSSPGTATTAPTSTTCAATRPVGPDPVRPRRSVDLHRADLAVRDARHGQHRLRDLPGPLAGGREHVPAALVPHERDERVHGAGLRRLRRQAAAGSCRAASRCTTPCCRTGPTWTRSRRPATWS